MPTINWPAIAATLLPNAGGIIGSIIVRPNIATFKKLKQPKWTPPSWVFGPVWTSLYTSMGYASYLVYKNGGGFNGPAKVPLIVYSVNLALNWAWPFIYFGAKRRDWAFYEIQLITATAVTTGILFHQINPVAGYLYIPYCLWLALATSISYCVWRDNPKIKDVTEDSKEN